MKLTNAFYLLAVASVFVKWHSCDQPDGSMSSGELSAHAQEALDAHNVLRKIHSSGPLSLNEKLTKQAKVYAVELAREGTIKHAPLDQRAGAGESLARTCFLSGRTFDGAMAVKQWYGGVCLPRYTYTFTEKDSADDWRTGDFTNLIWKATKEFGFGVAEANEGGLTCYYSVARYRPHGNVLKKYQENVQKGTYSKNSTCAALDETLGLNPE